MPCAKCQAEFDALQGKYEALLSSIEDDGLDWSVPNLSVYERKVFSLLAYRKGKAVAKESIFSFMYADRPYDEWPEPKTIDVLIVKLRKKLQGHNVWIKTEWGFGYSLHDGEDPLAGTPHGRNDRWTPEEDALLRRSRNPLEASEEIGRTITAVSMRASKLGFSWKRKRTYDQRSV